MNIGFLFWTMTVLGCGYAVVAGGKDGRCAAYLIISASLLTIPASRMTDAWTSTATPVFLVDAALLVGLSVLTLRSHRFFPVWMTGFHLIAVVTHLSTLTIPDSTPRIYRALESLWSVPMTLSLILGIVLDRRAARKPIATAP